MKKEDEKRIPETPMQKIERIFTDEERSKTDPYGSYTGKPNNKFEKPVQDADDL